MNNKTLLAAINAKYIHSNLAVRYINKYCKAEGLDSSIREFSINDSFNSILKEIYDTQSNIIAFSCYIWNIELVLKLCSSIKTIKPDCRLILGGPEASFEIVKLMSDNPSIDYVIYGEGERTFSQLSVFLEQSINDPNNIPCDIAGIAYRDNGNIIINSPQEQITELDTIPFPYDDVDELENKIIYYETSRGCPYNCQYCLSSTIHGVRFFSLERIKADIDFFIKNTVQQVKLVDRTFNCNKEHCIAIMKYIIEKNCKTNFHFEVAADLIDDDFLNILRKAPEGMFQLEIGVQSTNILTLDKIQRKMSYDKVSNNVKKLLEIGNTHLHLDLIAGLPFEDFQSFEKSFNDVYSLKPHMLQLGFLKLLKGSGLRRDAEAYGIKYNSHSPYEVLSTKWLTYKELLSLKSIEHLLELYYNSGRFNNTLNYVMSKHYKGTIFDINAFSFYNLFSLYWETKNYFSSNKSLSDLYRILHDFLNEQFGRNTAVNELLKLDWLISSGNASMPDSFSRYDHSVIKTKIHEFLKSSASFQDYISSYADINSKNVLKSVNYEVFFTDVLDNPEREFQNIIFIIKGSGKNKTNHISYALEDIINWH